MDAKDDKSRPDAAPLVGLRAAFRSLHPEGPWNSIREREVPSTKADEATKGELDWLERERTKLELIGRRNDIDARRDFALKVFELVRSWLCAVMFVIVLAGFGHSRAWFVLSNTVLIALITTTTVSVIGLFVIVANYLYKARDFDARIKRS